MDCRLRAFRETYFHILGQLGAFLPRFLIIINPFLFLSFSLVSYNGFLIYL